MAMRQGFGGNITAGELIHRVVFQKPIDRQSNTGAPIVTWQNVITAWARVEPLTGRELFAAQQLYPETDTRITIRGNVGKLLDQKMRMMFRGNQYDIQDITDLDEMRIETSIMAIQR